MYGMMATTESDIRANKSWQQRNRTRRRIGDTTKVGPVATTESSQEKLDR
jgi:hypothetical protein